ncbi:hypothetical protein SBA3_5010005 [Candidatus Sulfopaludibacter sp. SbA3]|nr:hypothetical protein SBA3_5010005 [Candidatus Sulfopaludibacter sp. SbA3]
MACGPPIFMNYSAFLQLCLSIFSARKPAHEAFATSPLLFVGQSVDALPLYLRPASGRLRLACRATFRR